MELQIRTMLDAAKTVDVLCDVANARESWLHRGMLNSIVLKYLALIDKCVTDALKEEGLYYDHTEELKRLMLEIFGEEDTDDEQMDGG